MLKLALSILTLILCTFSFSVVAQTIPTLPAGTAKGIVRDTANNYVLKSATVSIYKAADSTLVTYQITNSYGQFIFQNLPVDVPLKIEISHVGYFTTSKKFTIPTGKNTVDLQTIIINRRDITLDEVVISVPPMTVNGDTIEFNAAAFKLDTNATVEDMLKAIPNITVWGDGQITVNGSEVKSLKVNGKSFFGSDKKIATQNIAKNALQKVQVYNIAKNQSNPRDSILEMNLKLKKGKDIGYFGKFGVGYGSNRRFETDASINIFTPKMQLALVGTVNNVNKIPNNINTLMSNSTFKGVGTSVEYQPDFRTVGINTPKAAGMSLTYNFVENPTNYKKSNLKSNYFLQGRNIDYTADMKTTTRINNTDQIFENNTNSNWSSSTGQKFDLAYELVTNGHNFNFSNSVNLDRGESVDQTFRTAGNLQNALTSTNNTVNRNHYSNKGFNFHGDYQFTPHNITPNTHFNGFAVSYDLSSYNNENQRLNMTEFRSFTDIGVNQNFNRKYASGNDGIKQEINLSIPDFQNILFGNQKFGGLDFTITNRLSVKSDRNSDDVQDLDTLTDIYLVNTYLTNRIRTNTIEETPGLTIGKTIQKVLSNRFYKTLTITFHPKQVLITQDNKSDRFFQNIKRNYQQFVPEGGINFTDNQYGRYSRRYDLTYSTTLNIPTIQQLAPLTDSTNLYYLQKGNINLRAAVQQDIAFSFSHNRQGNVNTLNYYVRLSAGIIRDNITDSVLIDEQNRRTVFLVNVDGYKFANLNGNIRKAFKLKTSELQLSLSTNLNVNKSPDYVNSAFTSSNNLNTNTDASANYTYKNYFSAVLGQSLSAYSSEQESFNTKYSGKNLGTSFSISHNLTKKFTINSNITFNKSTSSSASDINFTIWNASAVYRILKGNNAEFKFSALDLLHQNSSVINYGNSNSFTIGTQNVLKQYFMITLSYYPRQFGKKAKVN